MHRRGLGRGRRMALLASVIILASAAFPWFRLGGTEGALPAEPNYVFDVGFGLLTILAALAVVALLTFPYAVEPRRVSADRGLSYGILAGAAVIGVAASVVMFRDTLQGLFPDRAPGIWLAAVGVIVLARAAYEISLEPPRR